MTARDEGAQRRFLSTLVEALDERWRAHHALQDPDPAVAAAAALALEAIAKRT